MGNDCFGAEWGEDSLFTNKELAAVAISSILRDFDLKKVEALCVEEALPQQPREPSRYVRVPSFIRLVVVLMLSANSFLFLGKRLLI